MSDLRTETFKLDDRDHGQVLQIGHRVIKYVCADCKLSCWVLGGIDHSGHLICAECLWLQDVEERHDAAIR